jgi:uncharacterized cupin superfamily protein
MVPEAQLEETGAGLAATGEGWFVVNAKDALWYHAEGRPALCILEGRANFDQLGINICVLWPGQPMAMYHWEADQEDFLVLSGEALLVVEGQERPLRPWDFVHCPPGTGHVFVGAGEGPCVLLCASSRQFQKDGPWGWYVADETAGRHGAAPEEDTQDTTAAYRKVPSAQQTRYADGWLPG